MKRSLSIIFGCLLPAALTAADAQPQINLSVSLAVSPAGQVGPGSPVTLTATATTQPKEFPQRELLQQNIRYTFSAQRTSPSAEKVAIATNVPTKTVTWTPQNPGVYDISVRATYVARSIPVSIDDHRLAPFATASVPNYTVLAGIDLVPIVGPFMGECTKQDCSQCPYVTVPIYVKNLGNITQPKQVTIIVKYKDQVIQTWTTTAPAGGAQVKVGSYTTFPWNCPSITGQFSPNYSVTVDTTNAVAETNEQNNVKAFWLRFPERTTFQAN